MSSRDNILKKLRNSLKKTSPIVDDFNVDIITTPWVYGDKDAKINQLQKMMEAVQTQFIRTTKNEWVNNLTQIMADKKLTNLLYSPNTIWGQQITNYWNKKTNLPTLKPYDQAIEHWKKELFFQTDASISSTLGGIAATGSLIVWPNRDEPRLMNIVPPVHFAILEASKIFNNFHEAYEQLDWTGKNPSHAIFISGPSKTADIEQILAYGAHGPKEFIVLLLTDA